jgi:uncharacterized protein with HEPN domain
MRSDESLLLDMLIAALKIIEFTSGITEQSFRQNRMAQSAVVRELQVIGEAARMISDETKAKHTNIVWRSIAGMRNRIIHEYFNIELGIVWETIQRDIPPLIIQLKSIIPPPKQD